MDVHRKHWFVAWLTVAACVGTLGTLQAQTKAAKATSSQGVAQGADALRAYPVDRAVAEHVAAQLQQKYAGRTDVRIAADARGGQILVVAPADVQASVAKQIPSLSRSTTRATGNRPATAPQPGGKRVSAQVALRKTTPRQLSESLGRAFRPASTGGSEAAFIVPLADGSEGLVTVDDKSKTARIGAPSNALPVLRRLVQSLDVERPASSVTDVVTLQKAQPATIARAMKLAGAPTPSEANNRQHIGQFVTMVFQPRDEGDDERRDDRNQPGQDDQPPPDEMPEEPADEEFGAIGDVRIEFIEGLDQIVVSGRRRDVERVLRIIEQIE
jgi:general secretion pathway protein D